MGDRRLFIDTQLLVLLAVGAASETIILKHKRTKQFTVADFRLLRSLIQNHAVVLIPNVVTETSNLLRWHHPPERDRICSKLREIVDTCTENYVESRLACQEPEYLRLGVTDVALMISDPEAVILTADFALYIAADRRGLKAVNFHHERERAGLV